MITDKYPKLRPANILLVEDDDGDALLTRKALKDSKLPLTIHRVSTGEAAIAFLEEKTMPDMILLDLNLPGMSGSQVLSAIKSSQTLRRIPVVILTSSHVGEDILRNMNLHANAYMVKPGSPSIFNDLSGTFGNFWFRWAAPVVKT